MYDKEESKIPKCMKNGRDKDILSKVSRYKKSIWAQWSALFTLNHNSWVRNTALNLPSWIWSRFCSIFR